MRSIETAFLLAVGAFLVGFSALGAFYYHYSFAVLRFPLLAGACTLVVVVIQLAQLWRAEPPRPAAAQADGGTLLPHWPAGGDRARVLRRIAWLFSIVPLVFVFGYPLGLAIYLVCFLRHSGASWVLALAIAAASLVVSYGLFIAVLRVPLPVAPSWWPL